MTELDLKFALERYHDIRLALQATERQLDALNAKRFKVGGSVIRIPENCEPIDHRITSNLEKLEKLEKDRERYAYYKGLGDDFIRVLEPRLQAMVVDKYVKGLKNRRLEEIYAYNHRQVRRIIEKAVEMYVEKT